MSRILVVGSERTRAFAAELKTRGHSIFESKLRSRAVGAVKDLVPDVMLLEADAPPRLDREIFVAMADEALTRNVPVIHILGREGSVAESLGLGAHDVLTEAMSDVEAMARIEAALRHKEGLDALVADRQRTVLLELAGAVAHQLNQPLTALSVTVEMLQMEHQRGQIEHEALARKLEEMIATVDRMAAIVKQVQDIVSYKTTAYVGDVRILDLDASSRAKGDPS